MFDVKKFAEDLTSGFKSYVDKKSSEISERVKSVEDQTKEMTEEQTIEFCEDLKSRMSKRFFFSEE